METNLDDARVEAVKSATEIINTISKNLIFKDLDLFLIDALMTPRYLSFWSICDDWSDRDFRQVGAIYGGGLAILSLILLALGVFMYLPIVLGSLITGRYCWLRHQFTQVARAKSTHLQTLKIAKYLTLHAQASKRKSLFRDMGVKYTMLKYIKDKNSINGVDYLSMFSHIDDEVDFYRLLHGVIDDVLLYAVTQETKGYSGEDGDGDDSEISHGVLNSSFHHDSDPQDELSIPPSKSQKEEASKSQSNFSEALSLRPTTSLEERNADLGSEADHMDAQKKEEGDNHATIESKDDINVPTSNTPLSQTEEVIAEDNHISESEHTEDTELSLDDIDEEDFDLEIPESSDDESENDEDDLFEDIDDDVLEEIGLAEDDYK